jgi:hypothetical protein
VEWLLEDLFDPLDFSGIPRYPNYFNDDYDDWRKGIPKFLGHKDSPMLHVTSSIDALSKLIVVHKDVKMKILMTSLDFLEDGVFDWYEKFGRKEVSSLAKNFKVFLKHWDFMTWMMMVLGSRLQIFGPMNSNIFSVILTNEADLMVHKEDFHGQRSSEIFHPWMSLAHALLMHTNPCGNSVFEATIFSGQQHV